MTCSYLNLKPNNRDLHYAVSTCALRIKPRMMHNFIQINENKSEIIFLGPSANITIMFKEYWKNYARLQVKKLGV